MGASLKTWKVTATGRVQGVYYRAFTVAAAERLGVRGWVRNVPDGSVQAVIQHENEQMLTRLIDAMKQGPGHSRVDSVDHMPASTDEVFDGFEIRR